MQSCAQMSFTHARSLPARVLIAEHDSKLRSLLTGVLRHDGHDVIEASCGRELLGVVGWCLLGLSHERFDLIIAGARLPPPSGLEVVHAIRAAGWKTPCMLTCDVADDPLSERAERLRVTLLVKPFELDVFRSRAASLAASSPRVRGVRPIELSQR